MTISPSVLCAVETVEPVAAPRAGLVADTRLRANVAWMLLGNFWQGLSQWTLVVALAKMGSAEMVGSYTLGLAIALPVFMFSSLSLRSIQITDGGRSYRFLDFLTLRLASAIASLILIVGIATMAHYSRPVAAAVILISAAKAIEYLSDIFYGLLQREERMAGIAISMILRGTLSLSALTIGVWLTGSLVWGAAGLLASSAVTLLAFDIPRGLGLLHVQLASGLAECVRYLRQVFGGGAHKRIAMLALAGLPLGAVLMLVSLNLNLPRYFVEHSLGIRELGIFSSLTNLLAAGSVMTGALGQGASPRLAKYFEAAKLDEFRRLLFVLSVVCVGIGAAGLCSALLFGSRLLAIIYRPEYASHQSIFVFLMAASGFLYLGSMLGCAVTAVRCFIPQLPLFAIAAVATAVASMLLVPSHGLRGAAMAILVSAIIQCAGGAYLLRNRWTRAAAVAGNS